jgi:predicted nucleic acid-binding protein
MPRAPLLLDACIVINLAATNRIHHAAEALGFTFTLVQQAASEVGYLRDTADGEVVLTPIDLNHYDSESLELISLTSKEYPRYIELARIVDDGEAATIAVASERAMPLATDDRKARRLCAELHLPEPLRTLRILHAYADAVRLPQADIRDMLVKIRDRASYQPPRSDPDRNWWEGIIDDG